MNMDPVLLQQQLKNNSQELLDMCKDLQSWGEEMRQKERKECFDNKPKPSECSQEKKAKKKDLDELKQVKRKCMTYADWDNYDADKECEKVDENSDSELTDEIDESMKDEALVEKEKGNRLVKNKNWDDAIKCYTKAIEYYAYDPVFYANRALCYIKKNEMIKAEGDCNISLKLDNTYVKAYQRRAAAREVLNKLEEAKLDLLRVLEFEPKNTETKHELERLKTKMKSKSTNGCTEPQRPISKFTASRKLQKNISPSTSSNSFVKDSVSKPAQDIELEKPKTVWPTGDKVSLVKAVKKPPHLRSKKPLKRIPIKEVNSMIPDLEISQETADKTSSWPRKDVGSKTISCNDFKIIEHKTPENEKKVCPEMRKEVKNLNNFDMSLKSKDPEHNLEQNVEIELLPTKNSVQFNLTWKQLKGQNERRYQYFRRIDPQHIPLLFKEALESQTFSEILMILADYSIKRKDPVYAYLVNFTRIKRFSALCMFFSMNDKMCLWKMFNQIRDSEGHSKEEVDDLILKYEL